MKYLLSLIALTVATGNLRAQYVLQSLEHRWPDIGLVAVVDVGPVTEVTTPQGLVLQSATAKIIDMIYRRYEPMEGISKDEVILYSLIVNGLGVEGLTFETDGGLRIKSGRAFIMVGQKGLNKFFPSDPWEFQSLTTDKILWPVGIKIEEKPLKDVISEIRTFAAKHIDDKR